MKGAALMAVLARWEPSEAGAALRLRENAEAALAKARGEQP